MYILRCGPVGACLTAVGCPDALLAWHGPTCDDSNVYLVASTTLINIRTIIRWPRACQEAVQTSHGRCTGSCWPTSHHVHFETLGLDFPLIKKRHVYIELWDRKNPWKLMKIPKFSGLRPEFIYIKEKIYVYKSRLFRPSAETTFI